MNDSFEKKYQYNKTVRFGNTLKQTICKNKSHQELNELVHSSFHALAQSVKKGEDKTEQTFLDEIDKCFSKIKSFHKSWSEIYGRHDQVAVTKDFYRILEKKARFDGGKQKAQLITLSSLRSNYQGRKGYEYIISFWRNNSNRRENLIKGFTPLLTQYKKAVEANNQAHTKLNLVNFQKMFLSLCNLVNEVLIPVCNRNIDFPNTEKLDPKDEHIRAFALEDWRTLKDQINELKKYISSNGGYTHYGKVTLNKYTAEQKPHDFEVEIKKLIKELQIIELVKKLKDKSEVEIDQHFKELNKKEVFYNQDVSVIERAQCFKYKPIPILAKYGVASYIAKTEKLNEAIVLKVLDSIGRSHSPAKDYKDFLASNNTDNFDLSIYPIKVAFDYCWEELAKSVHHPEMNFPEDQCKQFLKDIFGADVENDANFKLYADLHYIKENLTTLEYGKTNNPEANKQAIKSTFTEIKLPYRISEFEAYKKSVLDWLKTEKANKAFETAKCELGKIRGKGRERIRSVKENGKYTNPYIKLTNTFKKIASNFGKKFADLRDKFSEENELNKISHFGIILEDKNCDRYLLLKSLQKENPDNNKDTKKEALSEKERKGAVKEILDCVEDDGSFTAYQVKSLTSKALTKIVKNTKTYKDFHTSRKKKVNSSTTKKIDCEQSLAYIKDCLKNSPMAKEQNWEEFKWDLSDSKTYEELQKEIDQKSYFLQKEKISKLNIEKLVRNGAILLPIINQDITGKSHQNRNQFSKDWAMIFDSKKDYRLHPEFRISYRTPTEGYKPEKRHGRLQFISHFNCEIIPQSGEYLTRKELNARFNNADEQKQAVESFTNKISNKIKQEDYYVIGIDRGIKQLATLCVLDKNGAIQGDFEIYKKEFVRNNEDRSKSYWKHSLVERRHILDLSNLRVETTVTGDKVLVDQSLQLVKKNRNSPDEKATEENKQKIKLKQLAYIRKLQYAMQTQQDAVLALLGGSPDDEELLKRIKDSGIISVYGEGSTFADLLVNKFREMIAALKEVVTNGDDQTEKNKIIELDHADNLKRGVVANMVGVVNFIMAKYDYKCFVSLENLLRAYGGSKDGLNANYLPSTSQDPDMDFKQQQNLMLAGLGTYHFFEMQLLKKLSRIQDGRNITSYVPQFRSVDNYENINKLSEFKPNDHEPSKGVYVSKPFGIVHFIDPKMTSSKCPLCGKTGRNNINRDYKRANIFKCKNCSFVSIWDFDQLENKTVDKSDLFTQDEVNEFVKGNNKQIQKKKKKNYDKMNLHHIHNGDDNGAYHIALKTVENLLDKKVK